MKHFTGKSDASNLRDHVVPILVAYGVVVVEIACQLDGGTLTVSGMQFRDGDGGRVSRTTISDRIVKAIETGLQRFCREKHLRDGPGLITIDVKHAKVKYWTATTGAGSVSTVVFSL